MASNIDRLLGAVERVDPVAYAGRVADITGTIIQSVGPVAAVGELCRVSPTPDSEPIHAQVVGFRENRTLLMPLDDLDGVRVGSRVVASGEQMSIPVGEELLGRVIGALGEPLDGRELGHPAERRPIHTSPPRPMDRSRITDTFETGLRAVDGLVTVGKGQRMGVFSGSGVGKSTLLGEIARNSEANVNVIALIGERGREVREFVEKNLGEEGLKKSVVVVATSDRVALQRVTAGFVATTIAEYFRDQGQDVLLVMDSLSRLAWSLREIGLAVGEPPTTRGYTPSVFATLPRLVERCGQADTGTITGIYSVLVEGDDFNEPIADAARSFLDGHITLSRARASRGYYPSIDVLDSVSRTMTDIVDDSQRDDAEMFRRICATYRNAEDVIDVGVYVSGTNPEIDRAIAATPLMEDFLRQPIGEKSSFEESVSMLSQVMATAADMDVTGPLFARGTAA